MNSVAQNLIPNQPRNIPCRQYSRRQAGSAARQIIQATDRARPLGIAIKQSGDGKVEAMALATSDEVFVISTETGSHTGLLPLDQYIKNLLDGTAGVLLLGFGMARLAVHLRRDLRMHVRGIDLSTLCSKSTNSPSRPSELVKMRVCQEANRFSLDDLWNGGVEEKGPQSLCLRAWITACVAEHFTDLTANVLRVDTQWLSQPELVCLGTLLIQCDLLDAQRPKESPNEFTGHEITKDGHLRLENSRYRTRVRRSNQTAIIMTDTSGREYTGRARGAHGKHTTIGFSGERLTGTLQSVKVVGRQELTNSERARDEFVLLLLRGERFLRDYPFIQRVWFPRDNTARVDPPLLTEIPGLNDSQLQVVSAMIGPSPLVVVHGPPGTGKTTAIAAAAKIWDTSYNPTWIVAHSNVAVKNIAEKLFKKEVDFKILVSKEFFVAWHEHIYKMIMERLIRSDELPEDVRALERTLGASCVILSTLSTLSNPGLDANGMFDCVPVERLVIDEASQINAFEYMHVFGKFKSLKKICFFGDPYQLAPYGQDRVQSLKSIFDIQQLRDNAYFLDTQYRMPMPLGTFISQEVYGFRLKSQHPVRALSCIAFVDAQGTETKNGFSWKNYDEIRSITHLVRLYYRHTNFCIITPYDAQRAAIENELKAQDLPWDRVFNVDSFQGNEADFVLISVVRTGQPGFLSSINRMNVMLTRCRVGVIVVTSRIFLRLGGSETLLGRLARYWEGQHGEARTWVDWRRVAEGNAVLPTSLEGLKRESEPAYAGGRPAAQFAQKGFDVSKLFRKSAAPPQVHPSRFAPATPAAPARALPSPQAQPQPNRFTPPAPAFPTLNSPTPKARPASVPQRPVFDYIQEFPGLPVEDVQPPAPLEGWRDVVRAGANVNRHPPVPPAAAPRQAYGGGERSWGSPPAAAPPRQFPPGAAPLGLYYRPRALYNPWANAFWEAPAQASSSREAPNRRYGNIYSRRH